MSTSLIPVTGRMISYSQLGFYQLLYEIPNAEYPKKYAADILDPLLNYDKENASMLYDTLCTYLSCGCNKVKTSKELYLHRNTLLGRLDKIEKILTVSLEDPDVLFHLQAAIKIHRFFTET
jgi:DNA-binding PucR family transcriptional regulator